MASEPDVAVLADLFRLLGDTTRLRIVLACLVGLLTLLQAYVVPWMIPAG